jgi:excisionase family DNA binding protein
MEELLTAKQACERLGIHKNTLYKYVRTGKLKALRLDRRYRFIEQQLTTFLNEQ